MLDGDGGLVNHLLHLVGWQGHDSNDVPFFKAIKELLDRICWVPTSTPFSSIFHLLSWGGKSPVALQALEDLLRAVGGVVCP